MGDEEGQGRGVHPKDRTSGQAEREQLGVKGRRSPGPMATPPSPSLGRGCSICKLRRGPRSSHF